MTECHWRSSAILLKPNEMFICFLQRNKFCYDLPIRPSCRSWCEKDRSHNAIAWHSSPEDNFFGVKTAFFINVWVCGWSKSIITCINVACSMKPFMPLKNIRSKTPLPCFQTKVFNKRQNLRRYAGSDKLNSCTNVVLYSFLSKIITTNEILLTCYLGYKNC